MVSSMKMVLSRFRATRMAWDVENDILVEYSKKKISNYGHVIHVINLFFYGEYDGDSFTLIWRHQDGLERREGHPGGVQQKKLMAPLCFTSYNPNFF